MIALTSTQLDDAVRGNARTHAVHLTVLAIVASLVPDVPQRWPVVAVVGLCALIPLAACRYLPGRHATLAWKSALALISSAIGVVVPDLWICTLVANTGLLIAAGSYLSARHVYIAGLVALGPSALAAAITAQPGWLPVIGTAAVTGLGYSRLAAVNRQNLLHLRRQLGRVLNAAGVAIHECDLITNTVSSIVGPLDSMTGWTAEEWTRVDHRGLIHPDDLHAYWIEPNAAPGSVFDRTARFRRRDGSWAWLRDVSELTVDANGNRHLTGMTIDVTAVTEALARSRRLAEFDQLTGLPNRTSLLAELERRLSAGEPIALVMLDIDGFKSINDTLGHHAGDKVLVEIAHRLRGVGAIHSVGRLGGDEFAIIVDERAVAGRLLSWVNRLENRLAAPILLDGLTFAAPPSIGIVRSAVHHADAETLLRWADIAMYEAKRLRCGVCEFDAELERASIEDLVLTADVPGAIERGELVAYFQPQVDLRTGRVVGAEALARWHHPDLGLLTADRFVHLLRMSECFEAFTRSIIDQAIDAQASCRSAGLDIDVSANVSVRALLDPTLPTRIASSCAQRGVPTESITIELTEDEMMDASGDAQLALARLVSAGLKVSIDDFGTGYSSFARLSNLAFDEVKLDRSFLAQAGRSDRSREVISSITRMAHRLGNRVVAEGVESQEDADALRTLGCDVGQGFLYGRAVPLAEFIAVAQARRLISLAQA